MIETFAMINIFFTPSFKMFYMEDICKMQRPF